MLQFSEVTLNDREKLLPILRGEKDRGCEYTFGNIVIWKKIYDTKVAFTGCGGAVVRHDKHGVGYLFPVGVKKLRPTIESMMADAESEGDCFRIFAADKDDFAALEQLFPGVFTYQEERDFAEYIYLSENLRELGGKKYHKKRNHIAQFERAFPNYRFGVIDRENIGRVREMNDEWCRYYDAAGNEGHAEEREATLFALDHFFQLEFGGGYLEADGRIVAYSMGEPIDGETYCVHIEKAFHDVPGSYAVVNRDFARQFAAEYRYINREDDVGEEGLRRAKLSYYPEKITDKITITKKNAEKER